MRKSILITNDDGPNSPFLAPLAKALSEFGDVTVCVPAVQQSAVGTAFSAQHPITYYEEELNGGKMYIVSGYPIDCFRMVYHNLVGRKPDMVVTGINLGENLSLISTASSGTMGVVSYAAMHGIPGVAFSQEVKSEAMKYHGGKIELPTTSSVNTARKIVQAVLEKGIPNGADYLNVNIPSNVKNSTKIKITKLAKVYYDDSLDPRKDPHGRLYYWNSGKPTLKGETGTDTYALKKGFISVTPISLPETSNISLEADYFE
ncbi:5'/3'-nucleotidase SurE [Candidatus Undinarchaeota archaeon]